MSMEIDIEGDFWKDILVHLLHHNMVKANGQRLALSDSQKAFDLFKEKHPDIKTEVQLSQGYSVWEMFITSTIKIRIFIQSQVKVTFLQKTGDSDLIKLADAKFPNNPFDEIELLLEKIPEYEKELFEKKNQYVRIQKKQKITGEMIKALLKKKLEGTGIVYELKIQDENNFILVLTQKGEQKNIVISMNNFAADINGIDFSGLF